MVGSMNGAMVCSSRVGVTWPRVPIPVVLCKQYVEEETVPWAYSLAIDQLVVRVRSNRPLANLGLKRLATGLRFDGA